MDHPAYDGFWSGQALDAAVAAHPSNVPTLWEQGLWDQEDMWGANHSWLALKAVGHEGNNWLVMGPWFHSQVNRDGSMLGPFKWNGDTALQFRRDMVTPFFNQYLKDGPPANLARVTIYNDAENHWDHFADWPAACEKGCACADDADLSAGGRRARFRQAGGGRGGGQLCLRSHEARALSRRAR